MNYNVDETGRYVRASEHICGHFNKVTQENWCTLEPGHVGEHRAMRVFGTQDFCAPWPNRPAVFATLEEVV